MADSMDEKIEKLLKKIATKADSSAMEQLYFMVSDQVRKAAKASLYIQDFVEDVVSQVFLAIAEREDKGRINQPLAWIMGMAKYICFENNRIAVKKNATVSIEKVENFVADSNIASASILHDIDILSKTERKIVYYKYWGKMSLREIAEQLRITKHSAEKSLNSALLKLKTEYSRTY